MLAASVKAKVGCKAVAYPHFLVAAMMTLHGLCVNERPIGRGEGTAFSAAHLNAVS
jgi:hypothetical protein